MKFSRRKAISPVLATVILIAITLVAGVAIAGFAFGLFGTLGTTANIKELSATCVSGASAHVDIFVTNSGGAAGTITGVSPQALQGNASALSHSVLANTASYDIRLDGAGIKTGGANPLSPGQTITGSLILNGGSPVPFTTTCT